MRYGLLIVLLFLAACGARPGPEVLSEISTPVPPGAKVVTIYAATTRAREAAGSNVFLARRADALNFAEFTISIPPGHTPGKIEWPEGAADPARSFTTLRQRPLTRAEFEARVAPTGRHRKAGIFIHGFNVNFQEGLFQVAQLKADSDMDGTAVLFSWPSEASVSGYLADKDAVTASRDGLADVLTILARPRKAGETLVLAHSMGCWLTAETLRQLRLSGRGAILDRLQVILAAPDIDTDVFRSQMAVIGRLDQPMRILVAQDDLALRVSSRIAGSRKRVGALDVHDPRVKAAALRYNIEIVDISALNATDSFNHGRFAQLAGMHARLAAGAEHGGGLQRAGAFVFDAVGTTLASPFALAGEALGGH